MTTPFSQTLATMSGGRIDERLTDKLSELIEKIERTEGSGSITLTLKIKHQGDGVLKTQPVIKATLPEMPIPGAIYFAGDNGELQRTDPRQEEMFKERKITPIKKDQI